MTKKVLIPIIFLSTSIIVILLAISQLVSPKEPSIPRDQDTPVSSSVETVPTTSTETDPTPTPTPIDENVSVPPENSPTETECEHIFSDEWSSSDGMHFQVCTVEGCSAVTNQEICSGGAATCLQKAICAVCGMPYGEMAPHDWADIWDISTEDGHAHTCKTPDCTAQTQFEAHIAGDPATESSPQTCTDCGYVIAPMLQHIHRLTKNEAKAPTCTHSGNSEYYTCDNCDKVFADSSAQTEITQMSQTILPQIGHNPGAEFIVDDNHHWYNCTTCGTALDKVAHTSGSNPSYNEETHWYTCICGTKMGMSDHADEDHDEKCDLCSYSMPVDSPSVEQMSTTASIKQEGEKLEQILSPAKITLLRPEASGVLVKSSDTATIDYSNSKDGYVMVQYTETVTQRLKVQVQGPTTTYTYNLTPQQWTVFPLSDGNGEYKISVYKNVSGTRYASVLSHTFTVSLENEFAPFLHPNQYVNYENAENSMNKAAELVAGIEDTLGKVDAIYSFVTSNISYDYEKAPTVQSGYLPDLDQVLADRKGICFDYASLMTGMLRSQNIPCKLIIGYADNMYHAWINVWIPDQGWIDSAIFFDGIQWQRMDPTFASTGGTSKLDGINYTSKYIY